MKVCLLWARRRISDDTGSVAIEAVLVLPILLVLFAIAAELFLISQRRVTVEHAAYAAARAAMVHKCPQEGVYSLIGGIGGLFGEACQDQPEKWENAARWALVAASAGSPHALSRGQCPDVPAAIRAMNEAGLRSGLSQGNKNRICYAFEPENVAVEVEWQLSPFDYAWLFNRPKAHAIAARVTFRYPVASPVGRLLADGQRADGTSWIERSAEVVLR